jgi:hypothetical protein
MKVIAEAGGGALEQATRHTKPLAPMNISKWLAATTDASGQRRQMQGITYEGSTVLRTSCYSRRTKYIISRSRGTLIGSLVQACNFASFDGRVDEVNAACCDENDPDDICDTGIPESCDVSRNLHTVKYMSSSALP